MKNKKICEELNVNNRHEGNLGLKMKEERNRKSHTEVWTSMANACLEHKHASAVIRIAILLIKLPIL